MYGRKPHRRRTNRSVLGNPKVPGSRPASPVAECHTGAQCNIKRGHEAVSTNERDQRCSSGDGEMEILFQDDFSSYEISDTIYRVPFQDDLSLGPWRIYSLHYIWTSKRFSNWTVTGFPWAIGCSDDIRYIEMPEKLMDVVLAAGDVSWHDYILELKLAWTGEGTIGPLFRYRTTRHYYRLDFVDGKKLRIVRRNDEKEIVLAERDHIHRDGDWHNVAIRLEGLRIRVSVDEEPVFDIEDDIYPSGRIGLRAEGSGRFAAVRVKARRAESSDIVRRSSMKAHLVRERAGAYPRCIHQGTVPLPRAFSFVHATDINADGRLEYVGFLADVLRDDYTNICGLGVYDGSGRELWYTGRPQTCERPMHSDVAYQISDLNGDGIKEILFTQDFQVKMVNALTGEMIRSMPTPRSVPGCEDAFPHIAGDGFHICHLRGAEYGRDFLIKDRYCNIWAYTADFESLWHRQLNTGHYPRAADINGDGRDEVMAGYSMLDASGNTLWTVPDSDPLRNYYPGPEHADSLWIGKFKEGDDAPIEIAIAASDLGFNLLDINGKLVARELCGHAQSLGVAKFRKDIPGRQFLVIDFWGNTGISVLLDCFGNRLFTKELECLPEPIPVKWDLTGEALFYGGGASPVLMDGYMNPVVIMPRGQGVRPSFMDVDGDGLDEFLFLEGRNIHIWGREGILGTQNMPGRPDFENFSAYGAFYL